MNVDTEKERIRALYAQTHPNHNGVTIAMLYDLQAILEEELNEFALVDNNLVMHVTPFDKFTAKMIIQKGISHKGMSITCNSGYFSRREAFTFASDGRIYFCGWASSENHKPFLAAMERWILKHERFKELTK